MYNENIKLEYIRLFEDNVSYYKMYTWIFSACEETERNLSKDICDFVEEEIYNLLRSWNLTSTQSLQTRATALRKYTDWCIGNNINKDHINHYDLIDKNSLVERCLNNAGRKNKIFTIEEVYEFADLTTKPGDAYLILAAFEGIGSRNFEELANLSADNIVDTGYFRFKDITIPVSGKLLGEAIEAVSTYEYTSLIGRRIRLEPSCPYALKPMFGRVFEGESIIRERCNKRYANLQKTIDNRITFTNLRRSGIIHHMRIIMDNNDCDFDAMLSTPEFAKVKKIYNFENHPDFKIRSNYKDYF